MIVCICNRLNEAKIRGAILCGANSPEEVYAGCGAQRKCGTCHQTIEDLLQENRQSEGLLQAAE
jgi:bacterioferritin-associated ferredoxin